MSLLGGTDPWGWSVDQVVEALCKDTKWWQDAIPDMTLPEAASLETALRENETNGFTLLTYVDDHILKSDFGLKAVARRAAMRWAIGFLRDRSTSFSKQLDSKRPVAPGESLAEHNIPKALSQANGMDIQMESPAVTAQARAGETFVIDKQGRKMRKLVLGAATQESDSATKFDFRKKLTADQVFYGAARFGEVLKDEDDFGISQTSSPHPIAAEYVYRHFVHFTGNPKRESFIRDHRQAVVIYPYKEGSQPADQPRSVTLFTINGNEAQATREDASIIDIKPRQSQQTDSQQRALDKTGEEDDILPLYGDSDSEDQDEASLLDEMEADRREDVALGISKNAPLPREVVLTTIESRIQEYAEVWQARKLPLRERTARTIWRKAKNRSERILLVIDAQSTISHITRRLEKLKDALMADPWHSQQDIRKQCAVLEESVFQIQEQQFRISVWERATEPPKMPRATRTKVSKTQRKPVMRHDDDAGDLVNSESDLEAGSDGLDDHFIDYEGMSDHNPAYPLRLASSHPHTPAGDSGLCIGDNDVSMAEADDAMVVDTPAEPYSCTELSRHSTVDLVKTDSAQANTTRSEMGGSNAIDLSRMSISSSNSPAASPGVPINQTASLSDEALAELPSHEIRTWDTAQLEECSDRKRVLVQIVRTRIKDERVENMKNDDSMVNFDAWRQLASATTPVLSIDLFSRRGLSKERAAISKDYVKLYVCWLKARASFWDADVSEVVKEVPSPVDEKPLKTFWKFLCTVISSAPTGLRRDMASNRKRAVKTSAVGKEMREIALERQEVQAEKVRLFEERMTSLQPDATNRVVINISKNEGEGYIFVHPHIASRIKPHQISGVRFIWREVIEAEQGCLLAHTMGLGKTMQAITFLVALTEAAKSKDPRISCQIPDSIQAARYLIICPASLVANWKNELRQWIPPSTAHLIGEIRSIQSDKRTPIQRMHSIQAWHKSGGIMILGYEMFKTLVKPPTSIDLTEEFRKLLLEGPNLIIADEAHRVKATHSQTRQLFEQFSSPHRIALTGSPLANSLAEYWSMIDWIAPGYLGSDIEFKAYFLEPIQEGLYKDSTRHDHRRALKCLAVLKREIEPKVNRADITVLKDELKSKVEFLITIPLSYLQEKAYKLYVSHMLPDTDKDAVMNATMWQWVHLLTVLCNHPLAFLKRVKDRAEGSDAPKRRVKKPPIEEDAEVEEETGTQIANLSPALVASVEELFSQVPHVESSVWSYKTDILVNIIEHAKTAGDKVIVFTQSIPTLDYLQKSLASDHKFRCLRLDGNTKISERPKLLNDFNTGAYDAFLMSTKAGGLGFNICAANRVVLFDYGFNPQHEEQAIGRTYRIGQQKEVYVYRLCTGGTFEPKVWNKALFKAQLASRVVDAKKPERHAEKARDYLFPPEPVEQQNVSENRGKDPKILDKLLDEMDRGKDVGIRAITTTETLMAEDKEGDLDLEEMKEVESMMKKNGGVRAVDSATFGRRREVEEQAKLAEQSRRAHQEAILEESRRRQQLVSNNRWQLTTTTQPPPNYLQPGMFASSAPQAFIQPQAAQWGWGTFPAPRATQYGPSSAYHMAGGQFAMTGVNGQGPTTASRSHVGQVEPIISVGYDNVALANQYFPDNPYSRSHSDYATSRRVRSHEPQSQSVAEQTHKERYATLPPQGERDIARSAPFGGEENYEEFRKLYKQMLLKSVQKQNTAPESTSAQSQSPAPSGIEHDADKNQTQSRRDTTAPEDGEL